VVVVEVLVKAQAIEEPREDALLRSVKLPMAEAEEEVSIKILFLPMPAEVVVQPAVILEHKMVLPEVLKVRPEAGDQQMVVLTILGEVVVVLAMQDRMPIVLPHLIHVPDEAVTEY
jgi:hypothetical protein